MLFVIGINLILLCNHFVESFKEGQEYWRHLGNQELRNSLSKKYFNNQVAKNVILFIGDGMGPTTTTAARIYGKGETGFLAWEKFGNIAVSKTYSANKLVTDSCSAATAMYSGIKANAKTAGLDATVDVDDCEGSLRSEAQVSSIFDWAIAANKATGFVTTTRVTHATPSALYAHTPNRKWECEATMPLNAKQCKDIARQLVEDAPGRNINVIMGGGRQVLQSKVNGSTADPLDTWACYSNDGRDLIADWMKDKQSKKASYSFVSNNEELNKIKNDKDFVLGIFANGHLKLDYERDKGPQGMPSLANMTLKTIQLLSKNKNGYVLMVEGGLIDMSHHRGHARKALDEVVAFSDAIEASLKIIDTDDTLVIVTSDHAHSLVFTGYQNRGGSILDIAQNSKMDNIPYTTLLYGVGGPNNYQYIAANGLPQRQDPSLNDTTDFEYSQQAAVLTDEVYHSGTDVLIYATGPMSHLVNSVKDQTFIAYLISYAANIGPLAHNKNSQSNKSEPNCFLFISILLLLLLHDTSE